MNDRNSFAEKAYLYFSIFMVAVYVLTGLMLIFVLDFLQLQRSNRIAAGIVLIIYGCYRMFKLVRSRHRHPTTNQQNEAP